MSGKKGNRKPRTDEEKEAARARQRESWRRRQEEAARERLLAKPEAPDLYEAMVHVLSRDYDQTPLHKYARAWLKRKPSEFMNRYASFQEARGVKEVVKVDDDGGLDLLEAWLDEYEKDHAGTRDRGRDAGRDGALGH